MPTVIDVDLPPIHYDSFLMEIELMNVTLQRLGAFYNDNLYTFGTLEVVLNALGNLLYMIIRENLYCPSFNNIQPRRKVIYYTFKMRLFKQSMDMEDGDTIEVFTQQSGGDEISESTLTNKKYPYNQKSINKSSEKCRNVSVIVHKRTCCSIISTSKCSRREFKNRL